MPELTLPVPVRSAIYAAREAPVADHRGRWIAADAALTALVLADAGLDTVPGLCVPRGRSLEFLDPVRVRPVRGARGPAWQVATSPGELRLALARAFAVDTHAWVEDLADGRELEISVVRLRGGSTLAGVPHEVGAGLLFAQDRPVVDSGGFVAAAGLADLDLARVRRVATTAYDVLDLRRPAVVTVVLDAPRVRVAAVDPDPSLEPGSRCRQALAAAGWSATPGHAATRGY